MDHQLAYSTLWKIVLGSPLPPPCLIECNFPVAKNELRFILSRTLATTMGMKVEAVAPLSSTLNTAFWLCLYSAANMSVMCTVEVLIWAK